MKEYTVALNAEYTVSTDADVFESEDIAVTEIESALNGYADEIDVFIVNTVKKLFVGHIVKASVNMVVNVEATSYESAYDKAVDKIEAVPYKEYINEIAIGTYDVALAEEKAFLQRAPKAI